MGLRTVRLDLHLHTVVSPCAEVEMIPPLIVKRACELGLDLIAVTDHNTAENVQAVQRAAARTELKVLPGMEVQTREEVHILCLFDTVEQVHRWQETVYSSLPSLKNDPEALGAQFVVDETGDFVHMCDRLLLTSSELSTEEVVAGVRTLGGLPIAAHVDRPSFGLLSNLGFIPEGLDLAGLEISRRTRIEAFLDAHEELARWSFVCCSDAHRLSDMCARTEARVAELTLAEIELALGRAQGRSINVLPDHDLASW